MTRFVWEPTLATGQPEIDEQHRGIFALADELAEAIDSGHATEEIVADCVWRLTDYVIQHFADEEQLMEDARFPERAVHRSLHEHLTAETLRIAARFFNGEDLQPATLAPFLAGWLRDHILTEDLRLAEHLASRSRSE
jgi:hemerythrin